MDGLGVDVIGAVLLVDDNVDIFMYLTLKMIRIYTFFFVFKNFYFVLGLIWWQELVLQAQQWHLVRYDVGNLLLLYLIVRYIATTLVFTLESSKLY